MASIDFTNGVTLSDAGWADDVDVSAYSVLTSVSGTNTIVATGAATYSYAATRTPIWFIPANTNSGATTINVTPSGGSALGTKNVFWNGAACVGGELRQNVPAALIYDGTQLHIIANGFNGPFLDTHPVVQGSADSTKKVRLEADGLTTATTRVLTVLDADFSIGGATQAQQETGTATTVSVTPGVQHHHPSAAKAWVSFNGTGTIAIIGTPFNVTSLTDNGVGNYSVNLTTAFSSANYCAVCGATPSGAGNGTAAGQGAGSTSSAIEVLVTCGATNAAADSAVVCVAAYGDQ